MSQILDLSEQYPDVHLPDVSDKTYKLDHYISDPDLYKAVMFTCRLIDEDRKTINEAVNISGKYYKKDITDIRLNLPHEICKKAPAGKHYTNRLYVDVNIGGTYKPVAIILSDHNMCCCEDKAPYLLTKCRVSGRDIYSCQCSCGAWCTGGHGKPEDAVKEYESMCERYIKKQ